MEIFTQAGAIILSRWTHVLSGVTWIGLLYYFNFVQVPSFAQFEAAPRTEAIRKLVPRALWWFRWGAALTLLTGVLILVTQENLTDGDYWSTGSGASIALGALLAIVMFTNVWAVIWPNQKIVIASAEATAAGGEALPNAAAAGRKGLCASRTNTLFSIPMVFFMVATSHFAGVFGSDVNSGVVLLIAVVIIAIIEGIALTAPAAGAAQAWHIDTHRNTIIGGFVLWVIFLLLFEFVL